MGNFPTSHVYQRVTRQPLICCELVKEATLHLSFSKSMDFCIPVFLLWLQVQGHGCWKVYGCQEGTGDLWKFADSGGVTNIVGITLWTQRLMGWCHNYYNAFLVFHQMIVPSVCAIFFGGGIGTNDVPAWFVLGLLEKSGLWMSMRDGKLRDLSRMAGGKLNWDCAKFIAFGQRVSSCIHFWEVGLMNWIPTCVDGIKYTCIHYIYIYIHIFIMLCYVILYNILYYILLY